MRKTAFLILSLFPFLVANAQIGGTGVYKFMNLHPSARVAALGGSNISIIDRDINMALLNPALLNPQMDHQATFNTVNYFGDINSGYVAYAQTFKKAGTFSAGLQYMNYGKFQGTTPQGIPTGTFTAGDYNLVIGYGQQWKRFSYGASLKMIYSDLEIYTSLGVATDLGGAYQSKDSLFSTGLVFKNIGYQVKSYTDNNRENLPFEIQWGFSKKLKHMPLRISVTAHNLQKFDLTYDNPNRPGQQIDLETGEPVKEKIGIADKAMRHIIIGSELLLSKNLHLRFAYNHMRRKEMTIEGKRGLVGFSWGLGMRINRFHLSYGSASYYVGQNTNQFSVVTNIHQWKRKRAASEEKPKEKRKSVKRNNL